MKSIYIVACAALPDLYKIGISDEPPKRLLQLQQGCPHLLHYHFCKPVKQAGKIEKILHTYFEADNTQGEWFTLDKRKIQDISLILGILADYS